MKKIAIAAVALLSLAAGTTASARDPIADSIAARKAAFVLTAANFGPMGAMAEGKMPFDKDIFALRAANVEMLSKMPWEYFIPGSDKGDTKSKPEVWSKAADYKAEIDKFQSEVAKLSLLSKSGDENAMKAQFVAVAKSCKSCHQGFKNK